MWIVQLQEVMMALHLQNSPPKAIGRRDGLEDHLEVGRKWVEFLWIALARSWIIYTPQKGANASSN